MVLKRGSNSGVGTPGRHESVLGVLEMAALEDLGPKTRYALANAPLKILATSIVSQIIDINNKIEAENAEREARELPLRPYVDPKDPALDARLAQGVVSNQFELLHRDRSIDEAMAGVVPLRAKPNPKSAREQIKAARLARRARW